MGTNESEPASAVYDSVVQGDRATIIRPCCGAGCGRHLVDADEGSVCATCMKLCSCGAERLGPYRLHSLVTCGLAQQMAKEST